MAKGRMINATISRSKKIKDLASDTNRMLFCMTLAHLDRDGRMSGDPDEFTATVVGVLRHISEQQADLAMDDFVRVGLAVRYIDENGRRVLAFPGFRDEQAGMRHEREKPSKFGEVAKTPDSSGLTPETAGLTPDASGLTERNGSERNGSERNAREAGPDLPSGVYPLHPPDRYMEVASEYKRRLLAARAGEIDDWQQHSMYEKEFKHISAWCSSSKLGFGELLRVALENFFADDYARSTGFSVRLLCKQWDRWVAPPKPMQQKRGRGDGMIRAAPPEAFKYETNIDDIFYAAETLSS